MSIGRTCESNALHCLRNFARALLQQIPSRPFAFARRDATRRGTAWRGAARRAAHTGAVQGGSVSVESRTRDVGTKGVGREGSIDPGGSRSERRTPSVAAQPAAPSRAPAPFEPAKCISDNDDGDRRRRSCYAH